jgi:exopolysaccharide biosynthesis polyprenyl glycosylphosphotransferase
VSAFVAVEKLYDALDERTLEILRRRRGGVVRRRGWLVRRALLVADVVGLSAAFLVAQEVYVSQMHAVGSLTRFTEFATFALSLPIWVVGAKLYGLYDKDEERTDHSTADDFTGLFHLITVCTFVLFAASHITRLFNPEFSKLFLFWLLAIGSTVVGRTIARAICRRQIQYLQNTVIVGAGAVGQMIARKLIKHPEYGLNLVGLVDSQPKERIQGLGHVTLLGDLDELPRLVGLLDVERVIVAFSNDSHEAILGVVGDVRQMDVQVDIIPRLFDALGPSISLHTLEGVPIVSLPPAKLSRSSLLIKRSIDIAISASALVALSPLLLAAAAAVKIGSSGPVFYRHRRVGVRGADLPILKFRTMYLEMCRGEEYGGADAEDAFMGLMSDPRARAEFEASYKLADDPRVTRVGGFLRRTSIDELPQLWNVLLGHLSLVGPRPITEDELERYGGDAADLLNTRPGITGYWQINGRSNLNYEDRVRLDMAYIGGWSLGLDLRILARTARVLLSGRGAA